MPLFLVAVVLAIGGLSLALGQDANWDLRNYHWYNAHALLTGRLTMDVAPAQVASFYNPALDVPVYLLAQVLPAKAVGFVLGAIHGANIVPLFGLAWVLLPWSDPRQRAIAAGAVAVTGLFGGGHLGLIGTTFYDNVISILVLGSAWLVVAKADLIFRGPVRPAFLLVGLAGLLVGSAVGLKQPTLPYAVGLCFAFLFVAGSFWRRMFLGFFFGIGVIAGILVFSGPWMLYLWSEYGNPVFPYFNDVIRSPWGVAESYRDDKFVPRGLWEAVALPLSWALDPLWNGQPLFRDMGTPRCPAGTVGCRVGEVAFRDLRIPLLYVALLLTPLVLLAGRLRKPVGAAMVAPLPALYLIVAAVLAYLVWLKLFGIYRYLVPLEMLAPVVLAATIGLWPLPPRGRVALTGSLLLLAVVTVQSGNWNRIPYGERFVAVQAPALANPDDTMVLQTGYAPTSFLITGFPPQVPFLRLHSFFIHPDHGDIGLNRRMRDRLAAHDGGLELLVAPWETWTVEHILPPYGLTADLARCRAVTSNLDEPMRLCPVVRLPGVDGSTPSP